MNLIEFFVGTGEERFAKGKIESLKRMTYLREKDRKQLREATAAMRNLTRRRILSLLALIGTGSAIAYGPSLNKDKHPPDTPQKRESIELDLDGFHITAEGYTAQEIRAAYQKAKAIARGPYWHPQHLIVKNADVAQTGLPAEVIKKFETITGGITNLECTKIISPPEHLPHEFIHFLCGPEASKKWPQILSEFVASANDDAIYPVHPNYLGQPWIQLVSNEHWNPGTVLESMRYSALSQIASVHRNRIPDVIQAALNAADTLTFENLSVFLRGFNIEHPIFEVGQEGEFFVMFPVYDPETKTNSFFHARINKKKGQITEGFYSGNITIRFIDEAGRTHVVPPFMNDMPTLIESPPGLGPIAKIEVHYYSDERDVRFKFRD